MARKAPVMRCTRMALHECMGLARCHDCLVVFTGRAVILDQREELSTSQGKDSSALGSP